MTVAAIVQLQKKQETRFLCSACGADRGCDCNAPALEREAARRELHRQHQAKHRQKRKQKQQGGDITTADEPGIEDDISPQHYEQAFLIRADQARQFAAYSGKVNKNVVAMARQVVTAWSHLVKQMEQSL